MDNEQWQEILATLGNREGGTHVKMNKGKKYIFNNLDGFCNLNWPESHSHLSFLYLLSRLCYVTTFHGENHEMVF